MKRITLLPIRPQFLIMLTVFIIGLIGFVSSWSRTQNVSERTPSSTVLSTISVIGTQPALAINLTVVFPQGTQAPLIMLPITGDTSGRIAVPVLASNDEQRQRALQQRLIVKNADLSIIVVNPQASVNKITAWIEENGGWVVGSNVVVNGDNQQAVMDIRVPAAQLNNAFIIVKREAKKLLTESMTGADVTDQYADAQSQVTNLEVAEAQLRSIMEKATTITDILAVYGQLTSIRGQIEQLKGRMQLLDQSAAFSAMRITMYMELPATLTPTITPTFTPTPTPEYKGWRIERVASDAGNALVSVFQTLIGIIVWAVVVGVPISLLIFIPGLVIYRLMRRRQHTTKVEVEEP